MTTRIGMITMLGVAACAACATVVKGTHQSVRLSAEPASTTVAVFDRGGREVYRGSTPATVKLARGSAYFTREVYTFVFTSPDREPMVAEVRPGIGGWYWGNFALGGVIGLLIVDPLTGAMYELPDDVAADLGDHRVTQPAEPDTVRVLTLDDLSPRVRDRVAPMLAGVTTMGGGQ